MLVRKQQTNDIVDEDGNVITDETLKTERWRQYFDELLNDGRNEMTDSNFNTEKIDKPDELLNQLHQQVLNRKISVDEVKRALQETKNGKAPGYDEIPAEILRCGNMPYILCNLFNVCFNTGNIPAAWRKSIITPIPKPGNTIHNEPKHFRGITLACTMYKVYCSVLNTRISTWAEETGILHDEQNGFRKSRSCIDHLSTLTTIVETRKSLNQQTFAAFIDFSKAYDTIDRRRLWGKLEKYGLNGKIFNAVKGIYSSVECSVRVGGAYTDWFTVNVGLKQGCTLSSLLFNLYLNDLIKHLKDIDTGIKIDGTKVSILCHADDIVLLSGSSEGLQSMLDALSDWSALWKMKINYDKSKVVHFRNQTIKQSPFNFNIHGNIVETQNKYKYLGLLLEEHLDMKVTSDHVAKAAQRALGLLIAKDKAHGGMPVDIYTKLYDCMVQSVIDYGACIWGQRSYSAINKVQNRATKYFLGLHKRAPNAVSNGDMGWKAPATRQWSKVGHQWARLVNMEKQRLTYKVFRWSYNLAIRNVKNWTHRTMKKFGEININNNIRDKLDSKQLTVQIQEKVQKMTEKEWKKELNQTTAKHGRGNNKLRSYRTFKYEYKMEPYVQAKLPKSERSAIAKFRAGIAPINIELGRYEGKPLHERTCSFCPEVIEDEVHVILHCPAYEDIRKELNEHMKQNIDNFNKLNGAQVLGLALSNERFIKVTARTCKNILRRRKDLYNI